MGHTSLFINSPTKVLTVAITLHTIYKKTNNSNAYKTTIFTSFEPPGTVKELKVHLKRFFAPEDHKRHEKLAAKI